MNKSNSTAKSPRTVRTTAFVLAVITVVTVACYIAVSVFVAVSANEIKLSDYEIKGDTRDNIYVVCGIHFSDDPEVCGTPSSENGFIIGEAYVTTEDRDFTPLFTAENSKNILVAQITHLKLKDGLYIPCKQSEATILPYHVEITSSEKDVWAMQNDIS